MEGRRNVTRQNVPFRRIKHPRIFVNIQTKPRASLNDSRIGSARKLGQTLVGYPSSTFETNSCLGVLLLLSAYLFARL